MSFSKEWNEQYKMANHLSVWPWSHLVSLVHHYGNLYEGMRVLEIGCGAGANIPFFMSVGADYYGIDGSKEIILKLKDKYSNLKDMVHITVGDFTKNLGYEGEFELIIDRSALTCNSTEDIRHTLSLVHNSLKSGGKFIGMDWYSSDMEDFDLADAEIIDEHTRIIHEGYFSGLGRIHFTNEAELRILLKEFQIDYIMEKISRQHWPKSKDSIVWDFVVTKG